MHFNQQYSPELDAYLPSEIENEFIVDIQHIQVSIFENLLTESDILCYYLDLKESCDCEVGQSQSECDIRESECNIGRIVDDIKQTICVMDELTVQNYKEEDLIELLTVPIKKSNADKGL
ncbi:hypothetical protein CHUAL_012342 [Chamberlinius hualienensis]